MKTSFLTSAGAIVLLGLTLFPFISHGESKPVPTSNPTEELSPEIQNNPDLKAYKAKIFKIFGSHWYKSTREPDDKLEVGKIGIRVFIKSDGTLGETRVSEGDPNSRLSEISLKALRETNGKLPPFPEKVAKLVGPGFWTTVTFDLYDEPEKPWFKNRLLILTAISVIALTYLQVHRRRIQKLRSSQ